MIKNHLPGLIIASIVVGIGVYYNKNYESGLVEEIPNSNLSIVKAYKYKDKRLIKKHKKALNYFKTQEFEKCVDAYEYMLVDGPEEPAIYNGMGVCLLFLRDYDDAEKQFHEALKLAPNSAPALNGLGDVAAWQKDYKKSISYYKQVLLIWPNYATTHESIAYVYGRTQQYELAEKHNKMVIKLVPNTNMASRARHRLETLPVN